MKSYRRKFEFLAVVGVLLAATAVTASAGVNCDVNTNPMVVRIDGQTEQVGDVTMFCTGGTPTPANNMVPTVNITVFLNVNATSQVTQTATPAYQVDFSEALLLIDEPNRPVPAGSPLHFPLLNCGNLGAPDSGPSGPGVCGIISDGNPSHTYDGTPDVAGDPFVAGPPPTLCTSSVTDTDPPHSKVFGCGRPNVFQARKGPTSNSFVFFGVPFDPQASPASRILHITNVRVNANQLMGLPSFPIPQIHETIAVSGPTAIGFGPGNTSSIDEVVGFTVNGLVASTVPGAVVLKEGFTSAWKDHNIATSLANSVFSAGHYSYSLPDVNYPSPLAQNVPGVLYNTEDFFRWSPADAQPAPNPPAGYGPSGFTTNNTHYPFFDSPFYHPGFSTMISSAGETEAGTRISLTVYAPGKTVEVPNIVYLHPVISPSTISGVMVLTLTDGNGAGPYDPAPGTTTTSTAGLSSPPVATMFTYEVLYSDPFQLEQAVVHVKTNGGVAQVLANYAPHYNAPQAGLAQPASAFAIPRFAFTAQKMNVKPLD